MTASLCVSTAMVTSLAVMTFTGCEQICGQKTAQAATPVTLYLDVKGMHCDGCVQAIDADVRAIDGVTDVHVSLEKHSAQVQFSDPEVSGKISEKVESAIRALGYTVTVVSAPN